MKISVISRWYNEEFFAPFFLNHYSPWVDEIIILLEKATNDKSEEIISRYPKVRVEYTDTGKLLNDRLLSNLLSDKLEELDSDWVIRADADEFLFPEAPYNYRDLHECREALALADGNLINNWYHWVYRHETDTDLDPMLPTVEQRRHGGKYTIWPGMGSRYLKPSIVKPGIGIRWIAGDQRIEPNSKIVLSSTMFNGAHWQTADAEEWARRNHKNESRLSEENIKNNWGVKNFTREMIFAECDSHLKDPLVI